MTTFFRFALESRTPDKRTWEETCHTTSRWESVPQMLAEQVKLHPDVQWRIVGEMVSADENGKTIVKHP